ncbi:hypothetical protein Gpo141_00005251 [Globisporangium polare]
MDANRRRILELAEQGDWDDVLELVEQNSALAKAQDDFGMLPLHWACTEPAVPLDVIKALLTAFPQACQLENLSGMAPLHVAIASKMTGLAIHALLQTYPEAAFMKDGSGRYPVELAMDNNLPKYTIDLIRKAGARAVQSSSTLMQRSASFDDVSSMSSSSRWPNNPASDNNNNNDENSKAELLKAQSLGSLMASRQASEYARLLDEKKLSRSTSTASSTGSTASGGASGAPIGPIESTEISLHLKELLVQLQQLSVDIRTSSSTSGSTYRSSLSSSSSGSRRSKSNSPSLNTVLWNPSDKLGFVMEPVRNDTGARIKKFGSRSSVLGAESLSEGDVLISINGTSVTNSSFATITRFLKHSKVTCKLCFSKGSSSSLSDFVSSSSKTSVLTTSFTTKTRDYRANSSSSSIGNASTNNSLTPQTSDESALLYAKVAELLDTTLKKVTAVEETVRLSSAMSFCA